MDQRNKIPTWLHGRIDYSVAGLLTAAAAARSLTPTVRRTLALAGATHASYSAVTDYEAGVKPWLSMRQHLALDALGGLALFGAGLAMRRQPAGQRALLIAAGLAELSVVAYSSDTPTTGPAYSDAVVGYEPLDTLKSIADDVFVVDSTLPGLLGKVLPVRMTVIRLPDGSLLLHSPTRLTDSLRQALLPLGPVTHLVAPNVAHWTLLKPWQQAFPQATIWAAPGLRQRRQVRRSGLRINRDLGPSAPGTWADVIDLIMVEGGLGFREAALFHRPSRTLVLTDLVVNLEPAKVPSLVLPVMRLFGSTEPDGMPPPYLRFAVRLRRKAAAAAAEQMLALRPERVVFTHGRYFTADATRQLRHSFRWLLGE
jgi:hypothetical protein